MTITLLRYAGGKSRAVKYLKDYLSNEDKIICSPFFGGGSFELYCSQNKNISIMAYDAFEPLINFWKCVKKNPNKLVNKINLLKPLSKEKFHEIRNDLLDLSINKYIRASYYFALNRSSFSGTTLSGGYSNQAEDKRFTKNSIDKILEIDLTNITFECMTFEESIKLNKAERRTQLCGKDKMLFLDPPYYLGEKSNLYGNKGDLHKNFDHEKLFKLINKRTNWILCYNDCEYIRKLYKNYHIETATWSYGMNKSKKSSEIIITRK